MPRKPITRANPYTPKSGAFAGRTFHTEREYRNALARRKGFDSWHSQQRARPAATSARAVQSLGRAERQARERALRAVARMRRDGVSLSKAAAREGTTRNTVMRHAGPLFERRNGRITVKAGDRFARSMRVLGPQGITTVTVNSSRQASLVAEHWNAIRHYLNTGDESKLHRFYGVTVAGIELETDPDEIDRLGSIGVLEFEDIYELSL